MARAILAFVLILILALGASWLADQPGRITIAIAGYELSTGLLVAGLALIVFAGLVVLVWLSYHWIVDAPGLIGRFFRGRKRQRGFEALSRGMIAVAAGDADTAQRESAMADRRLGDTSLALLLKVQTAQLQGKEADARRIFENMLRRPDTEALGLRGLFNLARAEGDSASARAYAERAATLGPQVAWALSALFELQSGEGDWAGALNTLEARRRHRQIERAPANRLAAVLRTARAQETEADAPEAALDDALEAHRLDPDFSPAAAIAARLLAEKGEGGRAARIIERAWRASPHPDLATVYCHVRPGDSARDRLARAKTLGARVPGTIEGAIAVARAALEAREFGEARAALAGALAGHPSQRVCLLMAEIEHSESGDRGRVREWLARAVNAPRDPAWTADGFVSSTWRPVSPVTGRIDAFEWRIPVEGALPDAAGEALIAASEADPGREALSPPATAATASLPPAGPAGAAIPDADAGAAPAGAGADGAGGAGGTQPPESPARDQPAGRDAAVTHQPDDPGIADDDPDAEPGIMPPRDAAAPDSPR
jgi:HemY protein